MAHHKSAIKRIKQNEKRNARNRHVSSTLKTYIKRVREAVDAKDKAAATAALKEAIPVIDVSATKGVIHKSNASRSVSRLTKLVNTLG
ncbi:MAG: 30S ribosomal protein S20 [Pseudomonadota bacterium]